MDGVIIQNKTSIWLFVTLTYWSRSIMNDPIQDLLNVHEDVHFETDILND